MKERLQQLQLEELANDNRKVKFITVEIRDAKDSNRLEGLWLSFKMLCKEIAQEEAGTYVVL